MKRNLEISDDEWESHNFNSSRVLKKPPSSPPPLAYSSKTSRQSCGDCVEINATFDLEDDFDFADARPVNRRRFVVGESDGEECKEVCEIRSEDEYEEDGDDEMFSFEEVEEDVVDKVLQKCAKISKILKKELYGGSVGNCDRYAEVENSSVRIVTQDDISEACVSEKTDFQPILKPYQIVGVDFLLLLYRKNIFRALVYVFW